MKLNKIGEAWDSFTFFGIVFFFFLTFSFVSEYSQLTVFPGGPAVKKLPARQEAQFRSLGREYPLEKDMATHYSIFTWESYRERSLVGYMVTKSQTRLKWLSMQASTKLYIRSSELLHLMTESLYNLPSTSPLATLPQLHMHVILQRICLSLSGPFHFA